MSRREKTVTAAQAQAVVDRVNDLIEMEVRKVLATCDGDRKRALRINVIYSKALERTNDDLHRQLEAALARADLAEGLKSGRYTEY